MAEVSKIGGSAKQKRLFSNAPTDNKMPDRVYLDRKRGSVFHKAFDSKETVANFKAPVYEKKQSDIDELIAMLKTSFLTKGLDAA